MQGLTKKTNVWFYAFIVVAVLLIAATTLAIVFGIKTIDKPETEAPVLDSVESGIYYYQVEQGDILLSLTSGNKFSISGPNYNKAGVYTVVNGELELDFDDDADGTATAVIEGNTIKYTHGDTKFTFLKQIPFTVSYNTAGGTVMTDVQVINGKAVSKPADPTKDGYVFIGWYTDDTFKTVYDFAASSVTSDTVIYARWIEKPVGVREYVASFDLGYAGAEEIANKTTIGCGVYGLETPVREGFTFAGWFVSMSGDGEKLTYEYKEGDALTANTTLYAVWNADEAGSSKLKAPGVSVSGTAVKWNAIPGASGYSLKITYPDGTELPAETVGTTTKALDFSALPAGEYKIEVTAIANSSSNNSETTVRYFSNKTLAMVNEFNVYNGTLVFNSVANATKYYITVDCGNDAHNHEMYDNGSSTVYDFNHCTMQKGGIKFTVTATANGYSSSVSKEFVYELSLDAVTGLTYDKATDSFTWNSVSDAVSYNVVITAGGVTETVSVNTTSVYLGKYTGEISVSVTPVNKFYCSPDGAVANCTKTAPAVPQGLTANNMTLSWSDCGADSYEIKIGDKTLTTTETTLNLENQGIDWQIGGEYSVQVCAVKGGEKSAYCEPVVMGYYKLVSKLTYNNKTLSWGAALGCTNYEIRINGGEVITVSGKTSAQITLTKAGVNLIEVKCADVVGDQWAQLQVMAYEVVYMTRSTAGEFVEYLANGDTMSMPETVSYPGFKFAGWYNVPGAASVNGREYTETVFTGNSPLVLFASWIPNEYTITFDVDDNKISNITHGSTQKVLFNSTFTLPVPESKDNSTGFFMGWYTAPAGKGTKLTDDAGNCLNAYDIADNVTVYAFFDTDTNIFTYELQADGTYGVKAGADIKNVTRIRIPAVYEGVIVGHVLDNGFKDCTKLQSISLPDTIKEIHVDAFAGCTSLQSFNVYVGKPGETYEVFFAADEGGALIYFDKASGNTFLEVFPVAKTGSYVMPDEVKFGDRTDSIDVIRPYAFNASNVEKIVVSKTVVTVPEHAFYNCSALATIEFAGNREKNVTIDNKAFGGLSNLTTLILPAKINAFNDVAACLNSLTRLSTLAVEEGGTTYTSVQNMLCDAEPAGRTLLYTPTTFRGQLRLPNGISGIGDGVFANKYSITSVVIPGYVTSIGANAFQNCAAIEFVEVEARNGALNIGDAAFKGCSNISEVRFLGSDSAGGGAITLGASAFENCTKLEKVKLGAGVNLASLGNAAFRGDTKLTGLEIDPTATVKTIGANTFENCKAIESFTVHGTITYIGDSAFKNCSALTTFIFADSQNTVEFGNSVFENCVVLSTIKLPATLVAFDGSIFDGCLSVREVEVAEGNPNLQSKDGVLFTKGLTEVLYYPKAADGDLSKLPWDSITKIGGAVFKQNQKVIALVIGPNVTEIGAEAFSGCINLTSVTVDPANNKPLIVGDGAFNECTALATIQLPNTTTYIGEYAFNKTVITSFDMPSAVTEIKTGAFAYTNIASITIPATVTTIGDGAFKNAAKLASVTFVSGNTELMLGTANAENGNGVFQGTALTSIVLPANIKSIGAYAFAGISKLASVTAPAGATVVIETIYEGAFMNDSLLTSFPFAAGLVTIGDNAFNGTKIATLNVPASVTYIGKNAFNCGLSSLTFNNAPAGSELNIANGAFANSTFTTVTLPSQLKELGEYVERFDYYTIDEVFQNNTALTRIDVDEANTIYMDIDGILCMKQVIDGEYDLIYCPRGKTGDVTIPTCVVQISPKAFYGAAVSNVYFEEYDENDTAHYGQPLLSIGSFTDTTGINDPNKYAVFGACPNLVNVSFPSHLDVVYAYAFADFYNYNSKGLHLTFNQDSINGVAFKQSSLRSLYAISIILPPVREIGSYAFAYNSYLEEFQLPTNSTFIEIPYRAFEGAKLTSFTVPAKVQIIGERAFYACYALTGMSFAGDELYYIGKEAFMSCGFTSFDMPDSVTTVDAGAFSNLNSLTAIELSAGLKSPITDDGKAIITNCPNLAVITVPAGHQYLDVVDGILYNKNHTVFYMCPPALTIAGALTIPEGITEIQPSTFNKYKGTEIILPSTLKTIGKDAFRESSITKIVIPANVTDIGEYAFGYCKSLTSVTFAEGSKLKTIGRYGFTDTAITSIDIPYGTTTIGERAFNMCRSLVSVKVPGTVSTLSNYLFVNCTALTDVTLEEGIDYFGNNVFYNTHALESIVIPASVISIGNNTFSPSYGETSALKTVVFASGSKLNSMGTKTFSGCTNLQTVVFGNNLKTLGNQTFDKCTGLVSVTLPSSLTSIPADLFTGCTELTNVTIPATVKTIGNNAFKGCTKITTITIPAATTSIGTSCFEGCTALTTVNFASGSAITSIAANAFSGATALTTVDLPTSVATIYAGAFRNTAVSGVDFTKFSSIGDEAFMNCKSLTTVQFSSKLKTIGARAFSGCSNIETLNMTDGLTTIGELAFEDCVKITSITLPSTLTTMAGNPFTNCTGITSFGVAQGNTSFIYKDGALFDKNMFTLIYYSAANTAETYTLPDSVHEILGGAFAGSKLKTFVLPATSNITTIPANAFKNSKLLEYVEIPATVTTIGVSAFEGCEKLAGFNIPESVTVIGDRAFAGCSSLSNFTVAERRTNFTTVGKYLFENCTSLTSMVEFKGQTALTEGMYAGSGLTFANIPAAITDLTATGVFANCVSLRGISIPAGASNTLGDKLFYGCTALESVTLPANITTLGVTEGKVFMNCTSLVNVVSNGTLSGFGISCFENCTKLETITYTGSFPEGVGIKDRAFANCTSFTVSEFITSGVEIGKEAFLNCSAIAGAVNTHNKTTDIGDYAFNGTNITEIRINCRELVLSKYAFTGLTSATTIYFDGMTEKQADNNVKTAISNTEAIVVFKGQGGNDGPVVEEIKLTDEEIKGIEALAEKYRELYDKIDQIKAAMLEYKKSGALDNIEKPAVSEEESRAIFEFLATTLRLDEGVAKEISQVFTEKLLAYKKALYVKQYLTAEEIAGIDTLCVKYDVLGKFKDQVIEKMIEYKKSGALDNIEKPAVTEEESKAIMMFIESLEIKDEQLVKDLINKLAAYKQTLYYKQYLTDAEIAGIEQLCAEYEVLGKFKEQVYAQMIEYKKTGALDNIEKPEVTDEELRGIMMFIESLEIKDEAIVKVLSGKLLAYKQSIYINANLTEEEIAGIRKLCEENEMLSKFFFEVCAEMIAYKQTGALDNIEKPQVTPEEERSIMEFINRLEIKDEMIVKTLTSKLLALKQNIYINANLTEEEIAGIRKLCEENECLSKFFYEVCAEMIAYKQSGALDKIEKPQVTPEEERAIMEFINKLEIKDEMIVKTLTSKLLALKQELYINANLTEEEIAGIRKLCEENECLSKFFFEVCAEMIAYKQSGALEKIEKPEVTPEEERSITEFVEKLEIKDEMIVKTLTSKLLALKQDLYISANLTEEEIEGIRQLCAENECLSKFFYEVCAEMIAYKQSGALEKIEKPEVTAEEERSIMEFINKLEIKDEMIVKTLTTKLLAYKQAIYDAMNPSTPEYKLTDEEIRGIEALAKSYPDLEKFIDKIKEAMLEYKKSGALDNVKEPEVTGEEERAITEFLAELGLKDEAMTKDFINRLRAYKEALAKAGK